MWKPVRVKGGLRLVLSMGLSCLLVISATSAGAQPSPARELIAKCEAGNAEICVPAVAEYHSAGNTEEAARLGRLACDGGAMRGCTMLGIMKEQAGELDKAKARYRQACDGGDASGCNNLGALAEGGSDLEEAAQLYDLACEQGLPRACYNLAAIDINHGKGNHESTRKLCRIACDGGYAPGCYVLGLMKLEMGDRSEAARLFKMAYEGGELAAAEALAEIEIGGGNTAAAVQYLTVACAGGLSSACANLGFHKEGEGRMGEAASFYKLACGGGELWGCTNLGLIEEKRANEDEARRLYKLACDGGHLLACTNLGVHELRRGNAEEAAQLHKRACDGGLLLGCSNLGYAVNKMGQSNEAEALFRKSCSAEEAAGCLGLVSIAAAESDLTEAEDLYRQACGGDALSQSLGEACLELRTRLDGMAQVDLGAGAVAPPATSEFRTLIPHMLSLGILLAALYAVLLGFLAYLNGRRVPVWAILGGLAGVVAGVSVHLLGYLWGPTSDFASIRTLASWGPLVLLACVLAALPVLCPYCGAGRTRKQWMRRACPACADLDRDAVPSGVVFTVVLLAVVGVVGVWGAVREFLGLATTGAVDSWVQRRSSYGVLMSLVVGSVFLGVAFGLFRGNRSARAVTMALALGAIVATASTIVATASAILGLIVPVTVVSYLLLSRRARAFFARNRFRRIAEPVGLTDGDSASENKEGAEAPICEQ